MTNKKRYMWLVHDNQKHEAGITETKIKASQVPIYAMELTKRYNLFVIHKKYVDAFVHAIAKIFPCECKIYEFSDDEMLLGEHYVDPLRRLSVFIPWLDDNPTMPPKRQGYDYFFFADFNATFQITNSLLDRYLDKSKYPFDILSCVKSEPAFYTGDDYYASKLKVQMQYADVLLVLGLLFKMVVENHQLEDEGSMSLIYGRFHDGDIRVFDRWCIANIWTLSHDASFGHEMPLFCQWELEQSIRRSIET
ncbi:MAG: hypothetical protein ACU83U_15790 [Gammaproteobacteria bacterium]